MSHPAELPPLVLRAGPSRRLAGYLVLVHLLGAFSVILIPLYWWGQAALFLALFTSLGYGLVTQALRSAPWAIRTAQHNGVGDWRLELVSGTEIPSARLLPTGFTGQHFAVLNFRTGRLRYRSLVLAADAIDAEALRRLRTGEGFRGEGLSQITQQP